MMAIALRGCGGEKLRERIGRNLAYLFIFVGDRDVRPTNDISERHSRPSVIVCKATDGFRSELGVRVRKPLQPSDRSAAWQKIAGRSVLNTAGIALAGVGQAGTHPVAIGRHLIGVGRAAHAQSAPTAFHLNALTRSAMTAVGGRSIGTISGCSPGAGGSSVANWLASRCDGMKWPFRAARRTAMTV